MSERRTTGQRRNERVQAVLNAATERVCAANPPCSPGADSPVPDERPRNVEPGGHRDEQSCGVEENPHRWAEFSPLLVECCLNCGRTYAEIGAAWHQYAGTRKSFNSWTFQEPDGASSTDHDDSELIDCSWCGGEGWSECDDPIQCCDSRCDGEIGPCTACDGRGHSQVVW